MSRVRERGVPTSQCVYTWEREREREREREKFVRQFMPWPHKHWKLSAINGAANLDIPFKHLSPFSTPTYTFLLSIFISFSIFLSHTNSFFLSLSIYLSCLSFSVLHSLGYSHVQLFPSYFCLFIYSCPLLSAFHFDKLIPTIPFVFPIIPQT